MLALEQDCSDAWGEVVRLEVPNEMPQDVVEMLMTGPQR